MEQFAAIKLERIRADLIALSSNANTLKTKIDNLRKNMPRRDREYYNNQINIAKSDLTKLDTDYKALRDLESQITKGDYSQLEDEYQESIMRRETAALERKKREDAQLEAKRIKEEQRKKQEQEWQTMRNIKKDKYAQRHMRRSPKPIRATTNQQYVPTANPTAMPARR